MQILTRRFLDYWYAKSVHAILGNFSSSKSVDVPNCRTQIKYKRAKKNNGRMSEREEDSKEFAFS